MTSLSRDEILETLTGALDRASNGRANIEQLDDEARIIEDVGLSSLDILDLRFELEDHWQMKVSDEELAAMQTVGDVIRLVRAGAAGTNK